MFSKVSGFFYRVFCGFLAFVSSVVGGEADISGVFSNENKISYSTSYEEVYESKTNSTDSWRHGMISGNGLEGVIESGSPYSDTLIYQNIHFIMPNKNVRNCPVVSDELESVKQSIVKGEDIVDNASYDDVYSFHPAGCLRISSKRHIAKKYMRFTDYETAETGVKYKDKNGEWKRTTFSSRADNATITKIEKSSENEKVNITLSFDNISVLANYGDGSENDMAYKKILSDDLSYLSFIAHYPEYENSELKNGGYATLTYVFCQNGKKEKVEGKEVKDAQYKGEGNPALKITDADAVYLITVSDRTRDMGSIADFQSKNSFELLDNLYGRTKAVAEKYAENGKFNYDKALKEHTDIHKEQFDKVTLHLEGGNSQEPNEKLIKGQKGENKIDPATAERAYYAGRYAFICSGGYATSRLYGMWTGEWNPGWGSKYTMDANVNLQTSSLNSGNASIAPIGYCYFILRQAPDWEENALATHGYKDAIQAPVNADGDKAVITETCYPYPFRYWNAGTSWMLKPLYETLLTYGNIEIPLSSEFDLNSLKSVLSPTEEDLTDESVEAIKKRGALDLEKEILLPLLTKAANYWEQMTSPEYYTDSAGNIHYEKGKKNLKEDETYALLPGYSPENNPSNYPSPSTANTAIDIAACRDCLNMLVKVAKDVNPASNTSKWEELVKKLPPYLYDETGALKEWACKSFDENNEHRHLSHLYCVWPLDETQNNEDLKNACLKAIENRESENEASHALVHRSLIAARLKDSKSLTDALLNLMNHKIYYNSFMTNHDYDRGSCYCTDFSIGYLGIINESLVYSNTGEIELLPALPESGFEKGEITGLRTRTRAEIKSLVWDINGKTIKVKILSDISQTLKVSSPLSSESKTVKFNAGEIKTLEFSL